MSAPASSTPPKTPIHSGGIFAALRRTKGVINATNDDLDAIVSSGERLAEWSAILIVIALVAEAILVFVPLTPFAEKVDTFIVDGLIASGVFGELFFHKRSSHAQSELQRRSNDRLAQVEFDNGFLEERAAQAMERAAMAEARAAEANLALEKFRAPRTLTPAQQEGIVRELKPFAGQKFSLSVFSDPESIALMRLIDATLKSAGWVRIGSQIGDMTIEDAGHTFGVGLNVGLKRESAQSLRDLAGLLSRVLTRESLSATPMYLAQLKFTDTINIDIGKKP